MPECMQNMIRGDIESLTGFVEYDCNEKRPQGDFWKTYDKDELINTSIERHKAEKKKYNPEE